MSAATNQYDVQIKALDEQVFPAYAEIVHEQERWTAQLEHERWLLQRQARLEDAKRGRETLAVVFLGLLALIGVIGVWGASQRADQAAQTAPAAVTTTTTYYYPTTTTTTPYPNAYCGWFEDHNTTRQELGMVLLPTPAICR